MNWMDDLPEGWSSARLGELVKFTKRPRGLHPKDAVPFLPMALISATQLDISHYELREPAKAKSGTYFEEGNLLVARITPCFENGKQGILHDVPGGWGMATTEVYAMSSEMLDLRYLSLFLRQASVHGALVRRMEGATGRMRLPQTGLEDVQVSFPDLAAQRRLVADVETLFARIDAGAHLLQRAEISHAAFRASVVVAALRGALGESEEPGEPAAALLERALARRRHAWEQSQMEKSQRAGRVAQSDSWKKKYPEPIAPSAVPGLTLPEGWTWATVDQLTRSVDYGSSAKTSADAGGSAARAPRVPRALPDGRRPTVQPDEQPRACWEGSGGSGRAGAVLVRLVPHPSPSGARSSTGVAGLLHQLCFRPRLGEVSRDAAGGTGQCQRKKLRSLTVPLPPADQQLTLRRGADAMLDASHSSQQQLTKHISRSQLLKQAILNDAFSGRHASAAPEPWVTVHSSVPVLVSD